MQGRQKLIIYDYSDALAVHFHDINVEWITEMFSMEDTDRRVLEDPRTHIIEGGGAVLFAETEGLGIVGTCALQKCGENGFELTKMGVLKTARGLKVGEFLLKHVIARAQELGADPLFLLTNRKCEAAIHLYEKLGFEHDKAVLEEHGARYERSDVAMRYVARGL